MRHYIYIFWAKRSALDSIHAPNMLSTPIVELQIAFKAIEWTLGAAAATGGSGSEYFEIIESTLPQYARRGISTATRIQFDGRIQSIHCHLPLTQCGSTVLPPILPRCYILVSLFLARISFSSGDFGYCWRNERKRCEQKVFLSKSVWPLYSIFHSNWK